MKTYTLSDPFNFNYYECQYIIDPTGVEIAVLHRHPDGIARIQAHSPQYWRQWLALVDHIGKTPRRGKVRREYEMPLHLAVASITH